MSDIIDDPRWAQLVARDATADGQFVYSVATTGVYCRPACAARTPSPRNVRFHADGAAAREAGFRPCKRCRPDEPPLAERQAAIIAAACRRIEQSEDALSLNDLADDVGLSPHHFHRLFRSITGVTPKAYGDAHRAARVQEALRTGATVTEALYDAGYGSSGRFYAAADATLGMLPSAYRAGGARAVIRYAVGISSLGQVLAAVSDRGVCAIMLDDDPDILIADLRRRFPRADLIAADGDLANVLEQVIAMVEAPSQGLSLPLDIQGTAFQQRVWQELRAIPIGATASYADVARRIGQADATRAVAGACASNKIAIAIPCHRIVRSDGALSGYRWGVERKRILLGREAVTGGAVAARTDQ